MGFRCMLPFTATMLLWIVLLLLSAPWTGVCAQELDQRLQQLLSDRLYQTNLRGPRWSMLNSLSCRILTCTYDVAGNDNQNTLTESVATSMRIAGLTVDTLDYTINRWDARWWSLTLNLRNGTSIALPTTGYWPYSGNSGLEGVTAPMIDGGTFGLYPDETADESTLNLTQVRSEAPGTVLFFDNPSPTRNYSLPGYSLLGSNVDADDIPELGNLTNPHWQSAKTLNWTDMKARGVSAVVASWVHTSDDNAALQFLPNDGSEDQYVPNEVPALYVGNSTGETIRQLLTNDEVDTATVVLDAPSYNASTQTVIGHLAGIAGGNETIIVYTHSDGPSIIEENGPILLLTMAEYFAHHRPRINIDFVITTGHISGGHLSETLWMEERPELLTNAVAAIVCEHFGATEWKDDFSNGAPEYKATGKIEPMWTMANSSSRSKLLRHSYMHSFEGMDQDIRMALLYPRTVDGVRSRWYAILCLFGTVVSDVTFQGTEQAVVVQWAVPNSQHSELYRNQTICGQQWWMVGGASYRYPLQ
ncbi:hypothetical protein DFS33DRAFT_1326215 [Desarmillaria ectypa]|nr:hypothetical protein DFS33DRAFT_1326215 [Desarmillaria ectypa]